MIRLAQPKDVDAIVEGMLALKERTGWRYYERDGYNHDTLGQFITARLLDGNSVCLVWDEDAVVGFIGASLYHATLPPHMWVLREWGWWGSPKVCAHLYRAAGRWGKRQGAELLGYTLASPGSRAGLIREQFVWKVLK